MWDGCLIDNHFELYKYHNSNAKYVVIWKLLHMDAIVKSVIDYVLIYSFIRLYLISYILFVTLD
jgi:hypothetical protein